MPAFTFESAFGNFSLSHVMAALINFFASAYKAQAVYFERREAVNALNDLTDRQLEDIGLSRIDIETVVEETIR